MRRTELESLTGFASSQNAAAILESYQVIGWYRCIDGQAFGVEKQLNEMSCLAWLLIRNLLGLRIFIGFKVPRKAVPSAMVETDFMMLLGSRDTMVGRNYAE